MAGLLSAFNGQNGYGLLSPYRTNDPFLQSLLDRVRMPQADAADEAMFARNPNGSAGMEPVPAQTQPDLNSALMSAQRVAQSPIQNAAPAMPQRGRVSGWRVLDRVLGGETVTSGLDAERARLQAEADRPAQMEQQARIQRLVQTLSPIEQLAYATNPTEFGKALSSNSEGYTLGAGGLRGGRNGVVASAPTYSIVNDTIYANDRGGSTPTATAAPGFDDLTNRAKQESDARLAALGIGIQQQNADTSRLNVLRPQAVTTGQGAVTSLVGPDGTVQQQIQGNPVPRAPNPADNADRTAIAGFTANNQRFQNLIDQITGNPAKGVAPAFELSPLAAARYQADLALGRSDPAAAAWANYQSEIDSAVSDALRLNTGPQTDQDAIREARALLSHRNNKEYVLGRLPVIMSNNNRLAQARQSLIEQRGTASGGAQTEGAPVRVSSPQEAQALPRGTQFVTPDGQIRVRR